MSSVPKICSVEGCDNRKRLRRNLCPKHYVLYLRHGSPYIQKRYRHGMHEHPLYVTWEHVRSRTKNPKTPQYKDYGGRGVKMCIGWNDFSKFAEDMGAKPTPQHTLNRIDNDGGYWCGHCPECLANGWPANCEWATRREQNVNRRDFRPNPTGYRGVRRYYNKFVAQISVNYKKIYLGLFNTKEEASAVYESARERYRKM